MDKRADYNRASLEERQTPVALDDDYPIGRCPRCGHHQNDFDGLGVVKCEVCPYCTHPEYDEGECTICGSSESALSASGDSHE